MPRPKTNSHHVVEARVVVVDNGSRNNNYNSSSSAKSVLPAREKSQDDVNREFEKQLLAGKAQLKSYSGGGGGSRLNNNDDADSGISINVNGNSSPTRGLPSPPPPPPPPPPQFDDDDVRRAGDSPPPPPPPPPAHLVNGHAPAAPSKIPPAPRLTHFPSKPPSQSHAPTKVGVSTQVRSTASGKRIMPAKQPPTVNPRDELMKAIRESGMHALRKVAMNHY